MVLEFQSTHPRRVRLIHAFLSLNLLRFQSTHPRRVRLIAWSVVHLLCLFQSTHPRRVRLDQKTRYDTKVGFNPRTHVGCDFASSFSDPQTLGFNPRTHVGCDCKYFASCRLIFCFNPRTHVGCDTACAPSSNEFLEFQSTHPRRVRRIFRYASVCKLLFQSTHPRRVRHLIFTIVIKTICFNPRTHVGCDVPDLYYGNMLKQFQSTHPRRVRPSD